MDDNCLLRIYDKPELCSPLNGAYIGMHGANGRGGRVANANAPKDYRGLMLADSPARAGQPEIYAKMERYVASLDKMFADVQAQLVAEGKTEDERRIKSLYMWSKNPGTGKTTTATAIMNEYLVKYFVGKLKRKEMPSQRPVYFLDVNQLQTEYNAFNRPLVPYDIAEPASRRYYSAIERGKYTDFAVLDDIGVRDATEGFRGDLHSVINHRVSNQLPTIYTSNIPISELPDVFKEPRLADRVSDLTQEIHYGGQSKRGARR